MESLPQFQGCFMAKNLEIISDFRSYTNQPKQNVPLANPTEVYSSHIPRNTAGQGTNSSTSERPRHYNPRVADALDKMIGMGFSDDDGWLTQLLVMKHGDISQVTNLKTTFLSPVSSAQINRKLLHLRSKFRS